MAANQSPSLLRFPLYVSVLLHLISVGVFSLFQEMFVMDGLIAHACTHALRKSENIKLCVYTI